MMKLFYSLENYFIGAYLKANEQNLFEQSRVRLIYRFSLISVSLALISLPIVLSIHTLASVLTTIAILIFLTVPFLIKFTQSVLFTGRLLFSLSVLNLINLYFMLNKLSSMAIGIWFIAIILIASFTIGKRWGFAFFLAAVISVIGMASCQYFEFSFYFDDHLYDPFGSKNSIYKLAALMIMPIGVIFLIINEILTAKDITEKKMNTMLDEQEHLIDKLKESEGMYKMFFEDADDMVYMLDGMGKFIYANPSFEELGGYKLDELKEYNFNFFVNEEYKPQLQMALYNQVKEQREIGYQEFPITNKDGEEIWVGQKVKMIFKNKWLIRAICIGRNITQAKTNEQELIRAKEEAIKASKAKAEFLSAMSHEIRTPMNAVFGMIHLLLQDNPRLDQIENMNTIKFSAENLLAIINDILDFSKIESGKLVIENTKIELRNIVNSIHFSLSSKAADKNIKFIKQYDDDIPDFLIGDPVRLSQVLNNLLGNAIKFTGKGHVRLEVKLAELNESEVEVSFAITDTGIGIEKDKLDHIFETFTQANSATTRKFGGTGLGLAITKKLLELLGSEIKVNSIYGQGSTFYFSLKFGRCESEGKEQNEPTNEALLAPAKSFAGLKVLLVEDNKINQLVAKKFISRWGADLSIAENGELAIQAVKDQNFDVVLMDLHMPVMGGFEATENIRKLGPAFRKLPIIALTASAVMEVKEEALNAGMSDFITKPFDPKVLWNKINLHTSKEDAPDLSNLQKVSKVLNEPDLES